MIFIGKYLGGNPGGGLSPPVAGQILAA